VGLALVVVAAVVPGARADTDGGGMPPAPGPVGDETLAETFQDQPTVAAEEADGADGIAPTEGGEGTVAGNLPPGGTDPQDPASLAVAERHPEDRPQGDQPPEVDSSDPLHEAEQLAQRFDAGQGCAAAGGCPERPATPGIPTATGTRGGTGPTGPGGDQPAGRPAQQPPDPHLTPQQQAQMGRRQRQLVRERDARDARRAAALEQAREILEQERQRVQAARAALRAAGEEPDPTVVEQEDQQLDAKRRAWEDERDEAEQRDRALTEEGQRELELEFASLSADNAARDAARADQARARAERGGLTPAEIAARNRAALVRQRVEAAGGQELTPEQLAGELDMTFAEARKALGDVRLRLRVEPVWEREQAAGREPRPAQVLAELNIKSTTNRVKQVSRVLDDLRRERQAGQSPPEENQSRMSMAAGAEAAPATPPTDGNGPDIPGMPPHVTVPLELVAGTVGYPAPTGKDRELVAGMWPTVKGVLVTGTGVSLMALYGYLMSRCGPACYATSGPVVPGFQGVPGHLRG
jgi:hypothetical protein